MGAKSPRASLAALARGWAELARGWSSKARPGSATSLDIALLEACAGGDQRQALALLSQGARPTQRGPLGSTCLMFAARNDQEQLFLTLCAHPMCDTRARDRSGRDALAWASARMGRLDGAEPSNLFQSLDESLFDLDALDSQGRHACQACLDSGDETACLFWLGRAPALEVEKAFAKLGAFSKLNGSYERAQLWLARSQARALSEACPPMETSEGPPAKAGARGRL